MGNYNKYTINIQGIRSGRLHKVAQFSDACSWRGGREGDLPSPRIRQAKKVFPKKFWVTE